jgi:hypothetical protein
MKTLNFLTKLAACLLTLILIQGAATLGLAFEFNSYGIIAWIVQICLLILCIRVSLEDWDV